MCPLFFAEANKRPPAIELLGQGPKVPNSGSASQQIAFALTLVETDTLAAEVRRQLHLPSLSRSANPTLMSPSSEALRVHPV